MSMGAKTSAELNHMSPSVADHFTPDGVFVLKPENRNVAQGFVPYQPSGMQNVWPYTILILLTLFFCICSPVFSLGQEWLAYLMLQNQFATTTGQILDKVVDRDSDDVDYLITYTFEHPDRNGEPQAYTNTESVDYAYFTQVEQGMSVEVYFSPDNPTISQLTPPTIDQMIPTTLGTLIAVVIGFVLLNGMIHALVVQRRSARRERYLSQHGQLLRGTLTYIEGKLDEDNDYVLNVRYEFQSPYGIRQQGAGSSGCVNYFKGHPLPPLGTPVAVWYADDQTYTML